MYFIFLWYSFWYLWLLLLHLFNFFFLNWLNHRLLLLLPSLLVFHWMDFTVLSQSPFTCLGSYRVSLCSFTCFPKGIRWILFHFHILQQTHQTSEHVVCSLPLSSLLTSTPCPFGLWKATFTASFRFWLPAHFYWKYFWSHLPSKGYFCWL